MDSDTYEDILYDHRILCWSARIFGTIEVVLFIYMTFVEFKEEINNHNASPLLTLINGQYFLAVTLTLAFIGLIIAYWKEGLGGGITLISLIVLFTLSDFTSFYLRHGVISIPSLYMELLRVYLAVKKAEKGQPTESS